WLPDAPHGLRLRGPTGAIPQLPGFAEGEWSVQDAAAQLAVPLLDPQPGETLIDACAAPGGKTTHLAEYTGDRVTIWAADVHPHRLQAVMANARRLGLHSIQVRAGDSRRFADWAAIADRVLLDVPCSGLGTLHHHADARWRMTPDHWPGLAQLQRELLQAAALWVKPGGVLLYVTCTLRRAENEAIVQHFLQTHPHWQGVPLANWTEVTPEGFGYTNPHGDRSGFFFAKLQRDWS
ncbi:MAG: SAM-dependent methyltransferase, partial [Pseudanabaenaceae cyanobacterium]